MGERLQWLSLNGPGGGGEKGDILDLLQDQLMNWRAEAEGEKERGIKEDSTGHVLSKN